MVRDRKSRSRDATRSDGSTSADSHTEDRRQASAFSVDGWCGCGDVEASPEAQMLLHDLSEWIRSHHSGSISLSDFIDAVKRNELASINLPRDCVRKTVREVLGAYVVENGISNSGLMKTSFFELFPKFFVVNKKTICAKSRWSGESARRARDRSVSEDSFYTVASCPSDEKKLRERERERDREEIRERAREMRDKREVEEEKTPTPKASVSPSPAWIELTPEESPQTPQTSYSYRTPPRASPTSRGSAITPMPMLCSLEGATTPMFSPAQGTPQMRASYHRFEEPWGKEWKEPWGQPKDLWMKDNVNPWPSKDWVGKEMWGSKDEWVSDCGKEQMIGLPGGYCVVMQYIDTLNAAVAAVGQLRAATVIAVDCEGVKLSATGELTLVQVAFASSTRLNVLVFDVVALGRGVRVLHRILEEPRPLKLVHDVRMDAAALHRQFGITVQGIFDTQLAHMIAEGNFAPHLSQSALPLMIGLNGFLQWCHIPGNDRKEAVKKQMTCDDQVWKRRPIPLSLLRYAVQDVALLLLAWPHLRQTLGPTQVEMCKAASERRAAVACGLMQPTHTAEYSHYLYI